MTHRGWMGSRKCQFCSHKVDMDHIFFSCPHTFGFAVPMNVNHLLGASLHSFDRDKKASGFDWVSSCFVDYSGRLEQCMFRLG